MKRYIYAVLAVLFAASAHATNYTLTLSTFGPVSPSVIYSSNPVTGVNCGSSNTACSVSFASGSTVTLTAVSASTAVFATWGGEAGCGTNSPTCSVLMGGDRAITARFNPTLAVSLYGNGKGVVTDASGTINCSITNSCAAGAVITQAYFPGTQINLTAVADGSSTFVGWTGTTGCTTDNPCVFHMNTSEIAIATFTSVGPFAIAVSTAGTGKGVITSSPVGIDCGSTNTLCSASYAAHTSITLTATPLAGYTFAGWANGGCSGTGTCVVVSTSAQQSTGGKLSPSAWFY